MGRAPCCDKDNVKKGPWSPAEDAKLKAYIDQHGTGGNWIALPQKIGLKRCGKSCRLRWLNYLRPNIIHGGFSDEEDNIICSLYVNIGSRWSIIAAQLPGRTDNDIKNYWNTRLKKKFLGKQRKENLARRAKMQEMKKENENNYMVIPPGVINQTPYWPELPISMFSGENFQYPFDISYSQNQLLANSMDSTISQWPSPNFDFYGIDQKFLDGHGNFEVELSEIGYGNSQIFYGGATESSSSENSNWCDISSIVYPSMASNYEVCEMGTLQGSSFIESKYYELQ